MRATRSTYLLWKFVKWKQLIASSMQEIRSKSQPGDHKASSTCRSWLRSDYYEELILPLEYRKGHLGEPVRVKKTTRIDNSWKCLGWSKRESWGLPCLHIPCDLYSRNEGRGANTENVGRRRCGNCWSKQALDSGGGACCARRGTIKALCWGAVKWQFHGRWYAVVFKQEDCWRPTYLLRNTFSHGWRLLRNTARW